MKTRGGAAVEVLPTDTVHFILKKKGLYIPAALQMNPFSSLQIQDNIWQSKEELNVSELSFSVLVTEVQLFEVSASCMREKKIFWN